MTYDAADDAAKGYDVAVAALRDKHVKGKDVATVGKGGAIAAFKPQEALSSDAQADAVIAYAQKIRDWPMLEEAIEAKLEDQAEFVRWWDETVTPGQGRRGKARKKAP